MIKITVNLLISMLLISVFGFSQSKVKGTGLTSFSIKEKNDTIDFAIADTALNVQKPLLLFCQGSFSCSFVYGCRKG